MSKGEVDVLVLEKVFGGGGFGGRGGGGRSVGMPSAWNSSFDLLAGGGVLKEGVGFEEETGIGDLLEDGGPEADGFDVDLGVAVEGAEGEGGVGAGDGGEWIGGDFDGGMVAPGGAVEAEVGFNAVGFGHAGGIGEDVGDAPVDGGQAGGDGIAEVGGLDGSGFVSEEAEAVAGGVTGEVDEDVDGILLDELGGFFVGE